MRTDIARLVQQYTDIRSFYAQEICHHLHSRRHERLVQALHYLHARHTEVGVYHMARTLQYSVAGTSHLLQRMTAYKFTVYVKRIKREAFYRISDLGSIIAQMLLLPPAEVIAPDAAIRKRTQKRHDWTQYHDSVMQRYDQGESVRAIAQDVGLSPGTLYTHIHKVERQQKYKQQRQNFERRIMTG